MRNSPPETDKAKRFSAVAEAVLGLLQHHGEEQITHTQVSRDSGVSRSWLYKYIGNSSNSLIILTIDHFGKMITDHGPPRTGLSPKEWCEELVDRFAKMYLLTQAYPGIPRIYFKYRGTPGPVGRWLEDTAASVRSRETTEMRAIFKITKVEAERRSEILSALRMGLMFGIAPLPLPEFALTSNLRKIPKDEMLALFERILKAVVGPTSTWSGPESD